MAPLGATSIHALHDPVSTRQGHAASITRRRVGDSARPSRAGRLRDRQGGRHRAVLASSVRAWSPYSAPPSARRRFVGHGFDGCLQSLVEGAEVGYHHVDAGDRENAQDRIARHRQQHRSPSARACLCARTRTRRPAESQNRVRVMSTTSAGDPSAAAFSRATRSPVAVVTSTSAGTVTTGTPLTMAMGNLTSGIAVTHLRRPQHRPAHRRCERPLFTGHDTRRAAHFQDRHPARTSQEIWEKNFMYLISR